MIRRGTWFERPRKPSRSRSCGACLRRDARFAVADVPDEAGATGELGGEAADEIGVVHPGLNDLLRDFLKPAARRSEVVSDWRCRGSCRAREREFRRFGLFPSWARGRSAKSLRSRSATNPCRDETVCSIGFGAVGSQSRDDVSDADHEAPAPIGRIRAQAAAVPLRGWPARSATSIMESDCMP